MAVLLERPEQLDAVLGTRKVRAKFVRDFANASNRLTQDVWSYLECLDIYEQEFRTPEIHKTGRVLIGPRSRAWDTK